MYGVLTNCRSLFEVTVRPNCSRPLVLPSSYACEERVIYVFGSTSGDPLARFWFNGFDNVCVIG